MDTLFELAESPIIEDPYESDENICCEIGIEDREMNVPELLGHFPKISYVSLSNLVRERQFNCSVIINGSDKKTVYSADGSSYREAIQGVYNEIQKSVA